MQWKHSLRFVYGQESFLLRRTATILMCRILPTVLHKIIVCARLLFAHFLSPESLRNSWDSDKTTLLQVLMIFFITFSSLLHASEIVKLETELELYGTNWRSSQTMPRINFSITVAYSSTGAALLERVRTVPRLMSVPYSNRALQFKRLWVYFSSFSGAKQFYQGWLQSCFHDAANTCLIAWSVTRA